MEDENKSKVDASLRIEKLINEWKISEEQPTKLKPIQLVRSSKK
jgi:hypothetical protein